MKTKILFSVLLTFALLISTLPQTQVATATQISHDYLILTKNPTRVNPGVLTAIANAGGTVTNVFDAIGVVTASSDNADFYNLVRQSTDVQAVSEDAAVNWLPTNEQVVEATADIAPIPAGVNTEPYFGYQWSLVQIHADQTAAAGYLGSGARVAVLDSGIITFQPDLVPNLNLALSTSFVPTEPDLNPPPGTFNHGTHVAGIIAAAINDFGTQGVAPEAEIVAVKVLSAAGSGEFGWVIGGIMYASGPEVNADVINMSLGATFYRINAGGDGLGPLISALNRAINHATAAGTLVVSAAGNEAVNLNGPIMSIPAQSGNGIAVSATGPIDFFDLGFSADFDRLASYSNYGISVVNVAAPGGDDTLYPNAGWYFDMVISPGGYTSTTSFNYYFADGTSMAAPHVAGLAALIVGKYGHIPPAQIKAIIQNTADDILTPGADQESGHGRINAWSALGGE